MGAPKRANKQAVPVRTSTRRRPLPVKGDRIKDRLAAGPPPPRCCALDRTCPLLLLPNTGPRGTPRLESDPPCNCNATRNHVVVRRGSSLPAGRPSMQCRCSPAGRPALSRDPRPASELVSVTTPPLPAPGPESE